MTERTSTGRFSQSRTGASSASPTILTNSPVGARHAVPSSSRARTYIRPHSPHRRFLSQQDAPSQSVPELNIAIPWPIRGQKFVRVGISETAKKLRIKARLFNFQLSTLPSKTKRAPVVKTPSALNNSLRRLLTSFSCRPFLLFSSLSSSCGSSSSIPSGLWTGKYCLMFYTGCAAPCQEHSAKIAARKNHCPGAPE